jgi:succinylarginine dihydrolase
MNFSAAALRLMAEKGLSLLDVADIVAANDVRADPSANERQKRCRANKKASSHAVTVTRDKGSNDIDILTSKNSPQVISNEITPPVENDVLAVSEDQVLEAYNAMAEMAGLSKARMTPERRKKLKTFVKRHPIDDITEAIWAVPKSRFLCGENDRGWKADLDFLLEPKKFTRLLEGSYAH